MLKTNSSSFDLPQSEDSSLHHHLVYWWFYVKQIVLFILPYYSPPLASSLRSKVHWVHFSLLQSRLIYKQNWCSACAVLFMFAAMRNPVPCRWFAHWFCVCTSFVLVGLKWIGCGGLFIVFSCWYIVIIGMKRSFVRVETVNRVCFANWESENRICSTPHLWTNEANLRYYMLLFRADV